MLTSILGLFLLGFLKSKNKINFDLLDWLGVFLALFALREVSNFVTAIFSVVLKGKTHFRGDEFVISRFLNINDWVIPSIMMLIGTFISIYVIFKILPLKYRFTFIVSGFIGGVLGFSIWFGGLGKLLIP